MTNTLITTHQKNHPNLDHKAELTIPSMERPSHRPALSQSMLDQILSRLPANGGVKFKDIAAVNGYTCNFDHVKLHADWSDNLSVDFSGCRFNHTTFSGNIQNALFTDSILNSAFNEAEISHTLFANARVENVAFIETNFNHAVIKNSDLSEVWFLKGNIDHTSIHDNSLQKTIFVDVDFPEEHADTVFVQENNASDVYAIHTSMPSGMDSQGAAESGKITIGLIAYSDWYVPAREAITGMGRDYIDINPDDLMHLSKQLDLAVENSIEAYKQYGHLSGQSIGQYLMRSDAEAILQVKEFAKNIIAQVDGLWIPGDAADIHPQLYLQTQSWQTKTADNFVKEVLEFSLIDAALAAGKPIMGVCHGAQIVNLFLGGDIKQNVWWQTGSPLLTVEKDTGIIGEAIKDGVTGHSRHSQAVNHIADELELVASHDGIVKALQAKDGRIIMLTQFHPEYLEDQANTNIVQNFLSAAEEAHRIKTAIHLGDILDMPTEWIENLSIHYHSGGFHYELQAPKVSLGNTEYSPELSNPVIIPVQDPVTPEPEIILDLEPKIVGPELTCSDTFWG